MTGQRHAELQDELRQLASEVLDETELELVEAQVKGSGKRRVVRLFIDRPGPRGVDLDDCQWVSQAFGARLDETELLATEYVLEVSSPGLDRPLRTADDFRRNTGRLLRVRTAEPIEGRREFRGKLLGSDDRFVLLQESDEDETRIPLGEVLEARQEAEF